VNARERCAGAHTHTFAKNANVWGTRGYCFDCYFGVAVIGTGAFFGVLR